MLHNPGATLVPPPKPANVMMRFVPPIDTTLPGVAAALARDAARAKEAKVDASEDQPK